jgi:hypothetical protein
MEKKESAPFISDLDTARFGFPVARVAEWSGLNPEELSRDLKAHGIKLIISKVNEAMSESLRNAGFEEMDTIIHYYRDMQDVEEIPKPGKNDMSFRLAECDDIDKLKSIAAVAFRGGHYFNDKKLNPEISSEIYQDWIERSCNGELADRVYLAEVRGEIAGFATIELREKEGLSGLWAGIGATHPDFRNMGVCRHILEYGLSEYLRHKRYGFFGSAVSDSNRSVKKVFEYLGCHPKESFIVFHKWL